MKILIQNKVENILSKGEIAHHEQFSLLPQYFQSRLQQRHQKASVCWKGGN